MSFSNDICSRILGCFFLQEKPPELYLGVFCKISSDKRQEVKIKGYQRISLKGYFSLSSGKVINKEDILFDVARDDWGEVVGFGVWDSVNGGTLVWSENISGETPMITIGKQLRIPSGNLVISLKSL